MQFLVGAARVGGGCAGGEGLRELVGFSGRMVGCLGAGSEAAFRKKVRKS